MIQLKTTGKLPKTYPYPLQCWRVGDLLWLSMGGEVVVDYSLQLKIFLARACGSPAMPMM